MRRTSSKTKKVPMNIVDFNGYKKDRDQRKKREYERLLFNRLFGVCSFVEQDKLIPIDIQDVSYSGIRFRQPAHSEFPVKAGTKVGMRFYFTPTSFIRLQAEIKRYEVISADAKRYFEYGCELSKDTKSYEVLHSLIQFMHKYSEVATTDEKSPIWM